MVLGCASTSRCGRPTCAAHLRCRIRAARLDRPSLSPRRERAPAAATTRAALAVRGEGGRRRRGGRVDRRRCRSRLRADGTRRAFKPAPRLVVLETTTSSPPESWVAARRSTSRCRRCAGRRRRAAADLHDRARADVLRRRASAAATQCDPDGWNPIGLRARGRDRDVRARRSRVSDVTDRRATDARRKARHAGRRRGTIATSAAYLTLEDAGFDRAAAGAHVRRFSSTPTLQRVDGQTLGYPWIGVVENWHAARVHQLRRRPRRLGIERRHRAAVLRAQLHGRRRNGRRRSRPTQLMPTILSAAAGSFAMPPPGAPLRSDA